MPRRSRCNRLPPARTLIAPVTVSALIDTALVPPRASLAGEAAIARMADDFRASGERGRTWDEMEMLGWTTDQLDTLAKKARALAQALAGASV